MTEDIQEHDERLEKIFDEINEAFDKLDAGKSSNPQKLIEKIEDKLSEARDEHRYFKAELRDIPRFERKEFETKSSEHSKRITELTKELAIQKETLSRSSLFKGGTTASQGDVSVMNTGQLLDGVDDMQDESISAVKRMQGRVADSKQVAAETMVTLGEQKEALVRVSNRVDDIEENLNRADKQIRVFIRRMATDKCISMMMIIVVILLVAVIGSSVMKHMNGTDDTAITDDVNAALTNLTKLLKTMI